ncbi:YafY family protein [Streptomyces sp. NBC_00572]|uniref:helix-turn-helix transcriptional regulator n=1 Tax=Streptomyces sp. NBC_00572 TaxID=2903664 RepID=UPI002257AFAC|nr:WYL domain-containing protein [Streptomyces sp. NBC_00572]MCX4982385.1 WYL domain-containing protein [Streptomyces sp. NBC_00572]
MRADRLVAALLFLQTRQRVTAAELAAELDVSERTARRDLEALASSGIPVYSQAGQGGGWSLVGGARTDLTGLTAPEIRALFLLTGPDTGASPQTRTALRKLVRALPPTLREGAEAAARAGISDSTDWAGTDTEEARLAPLQRAVVEAREVRIGYARPGREPRERTVQPLGIAAKSGIRYLVAGTEHGLRTFRIDRVTSVTETGAPAVRPEGFDLPTAWRALAARMEDRLVAATVRGRAGPGTEPVLEGLLGRRIRFGERAPDGWTPIEADGPSPEVIAAQLAGLGARVELLDPPEARTALARIGAELTLLYGQSTPQATPAAPPRAPASTGTPPG